LVWSFLIVSVVTTVAGFWLIKGTDPMLSLSRTVFDSALFFFAFIMLTEPLTTPPSRPLRIAYGAIVGFLFSPIVHIGSFYSTPEIALVVGNIFSYIASPKEKLMLKLKEIKTIAENTYEFVFSNDRPFTFKPGQYMEWTLAHRDPDSRGNRRYFTVASSPTEPDVRLGVKFYPEPSSFKNKMLYMAPNSIVVASQIAGDFVMPKDPKRPLVFIAGGIGVTPFRSMIKYLVDTKEHRQVTLFYSNKTERDVAYGDILDEAEKEMGIKTVYVVTNPTEKPGQPSPYYKALDAGVIRAEVPNYRDCVFYISGPHGMVSAFQSMLKNMGIRGSNIKTDYFPGF